MFSFMKLIVLSCLMILSLVASASKVQADEMKIASVDVRKIFKSWKFAIDSEQKLEAAREALERANNERRAVINQYQMERSKMHQEYQANRSEVTPEEKAKLDRKFIDLGRDSFALEQDRRDFYSKAKRNLDREVTAQSRLILDRITEAVQAYALAQNFDMVVEMGGHTTRNMPLFVHLQNAEDITEAVLKNLNKASEN